MRLRFCDPESRDSGAIRAPAECDPRCDPFLAEGVISGSVSSGKCDPGCDPRCDPDPAIPSLRFACNPGVPKVIDEACELGEIDIVCGDINQARWQSADHKWHEGTLDALESRQYMPIADYGGDSCFIALHRSMVEARPRFAAQFLWNRPFLPVSCLCPETVLEPRLTSFLKHYSALGIGRSINIQCHVSVRRRSWSRDCHLC